MIANVLLVTVTKVETVAVLEVFASGKAWSREFFGDRTYYRLGQCGGVNVYLVQSEMGAGSPGASLQTVTEAITYCKPVAIIMVGIAFGLDPSKRKLGDILVSRQISVYDLQKIPEDGVPINRDDRVKVSIKLLDKFRSAELDWNSDAKVHIGVILCGSKLIANKSFRDKLLINEPEAIGGEMEGGGLYSAAVVKKVDWIIVKAISDWADGGKDDAMQPIAALNAAQFVYHVISQNGLMPRRFPNQRKVKSKKKKAGLIIDGDYSDHEVEKIRKMIAAYLDIREQDVDVLKVTRGSIKVRFEINESAARELASRGLNSGNRDYPNLRALNLEDQPFIYLGNTRYFMFVGREMQIRELRQFFRKPYGTKRLQLVLGGGGIGKTWFLRRILAEAYADGLLSATEPIDLYSTDLRYIDGIQLKIIETIENLTGLREGHSPFVEFFKENQDTSEQFNACLRAFCKENPLVLAFDTFENLDTVASNWLFESGEGGLQVPGLLCIVAGRPEKENLAKYRSNPLVQEIELGGLSLPEARELYQQILKDFEGVDLLEDLLAAAGVQQDNLDAEDEGFRWVWEITKGHPLKLEMAFRWARTLLREGSLAGITAERFEERLMETVRELGIKSLLDIGPLRVSQPVFDTLVCMAYVTRRFDERFLQFLIEERLIHLGDSNVTVVAILENLERYFFVKRRSRAGGGYILQMHDEMARLFQRYVWPWIDLSGEEKERLFQSVIRFYDQLISETEEKDVRNILRVEQLYYALQSDPLGEGKRLWFELADLDDNYVNSLLPGEIRVYIQQFDPATQYEIHSRIAQMEFDANHLTQARGEWMKVKELAEEEKRDDWLASAMISLANCERDPSRALREYQKAKVFCEEKARKYLPSVNYNIGFTYRRMQNIKKAIEWYHKARKEFQRTLGKLGLAAKIANDLGYAYSLMGDWEECRKNVKEGQNIRRRLLSQIEKEIIQLEEELKSATSKEAIGKLQDQLNRQRIRSSKACFQLGLSYSTLGEISRFDEDLDESLRNYGEALKLFQVSNNYQWQARALSSRGETYRRIARTRYWRGDEAIYRDYMKKAQEDIQESLYLSKKYRIKMEWDSINRRMGRVVHDLAMYELEQSNKAEGRKYLEQARSYFEEGVKFARETNDVLEELSNLAELAFIVDDFMKVVVPKKVPQKYQDSLDDFKRALENHRNDRYRIHQFSVFDNLYKLENAATDYQNGKYKQSLKGYLEAFVGLASDPGYGRTRYKQHFPRLMEQLEKLPARKARAWCQAFIESWESTSIPGRKGRTLAQEVLPDMVVACRLHLSKIEAQKM